MKKVVIEIIAGASCIAAGVTAGWFNARLYKDHIEKNPKNKIVKSVLGVITTVGVTNCVAGMAGDFCYKVLDINVYDIKDHNTNSEEVEA